MKEFFWGLLTVVACITLIAIATPWVGQFLIHYVGPWAVRYDSYVTCVVTGRKC